MGDGPPSVVWLTLDSVRADHTTMNGYRRDTTPRMQAIADESGGEAFTDCITPAMWSLPADASTLTGTYPSCHGVGWRNEVVPEELDTVPELFGERGYETAGISFNAYFNESTGLDRGFDRFEWLTTSNLLSGVGPSILARYALGLRRHGAGFTGPIRRHRSEYLAFALARRWLRDLADGPDPFFMFVHTLGAHVPYAPPLPYRDRFTDDIEMGVDEAVEFAFDASDNHYRETARGCDYERAERDALDAAYDGLLAYVDEQVGSLFDFLETLAVDDLVVVVTADHGDLLGERGVLGHQLLLHDGLVNVPMVVHGLDTLRGRGDEVVQPIDVMQTLLGMAGGRTEQFQGIDLRESARRYALVQRGAETARTALAELERHGATVDADRFGDEPLHGLRDSRHKLVRGEGADGGDLYELPDEETDVSADRPDVADRFERALDDRLDRLGGGLTSRGERELTDAMRDRLADLGYVVD